MVTGRGGGYSYREESMVTGKGRIPFVYNHCDDNYDKQHRKSGERAG